MSLASKVASRLRTYSAAERVQRTARVVLDDVLVIAFADGSSQQLREAS